LLNKRQEANLKSNVTFTNSLYTLISFTVLLLLIALFTVRHNLKQEVRYRESSILEAKSQEMEQFTYFTSHELRHPVLTIQSYIKIFEEENSGKLDDTGKQYLKCMSNLASQMDTLIQGVFNYSRLSKTKKWEQIDCNEVIQSVLFDLNSIIQSSSAKITVMPLPVLKGSPSDIKQLFLGFTTNALKFRKVNSVPELAISARKDEGSYIFEFCDKGIGIEEKNQKKIFNIFRRLHTTEEFEGFGLGLAYCKKIVELHHGRIWVKSKLGQGSSFYFTIKI
jgi:light-regulated signal transduction histidine kinase (bacteriophytochrome)